MNTHRNAGGVFASVAVVVTALIVLVNALAALVGRELGGVAAFFAVQVAVTALLLVPAVLSKLGDRETLSVYRAMQHR